MAILEVKGLKKSFGAHEVLKGIDFELNRGEVLAIIGSSGSGKTTLLRCLNFLETADEGSITVNGEVLFDGAQAEKKNSEDIRKKRLHFGLVFQQFNLFPHYNAITNIKLAAELLGKEKSRKECAAIDAERRRERAALTASQKAELAALENDGKLIKQELKAAKKQLKASHRAKLIEFDDVTAAKKTAVRERLFGDIDRRAQALLDRVGLGDRAKAYPCELSGGQQQRIAIARALALSPDILCFDEPTSALDPELTGEVLKVIKGLKSGDSTMIVVTHEMDFARNVADKVIFMADGVIEEMGSPYQIFEEPQSEKTKAFLQKSREQTLGDVRSSRSRRAKRPKPSCKSPASRPSATLRRQSDRSVPLPAARNCSHLKARDLRMMLLRGPRKAAQCGILAERFPGGIKASTICGGKETKALMRAPCKMQGVANFALRRHGAGNNMHIGK